MKKKIYNYISIILFLATCIALVCFFCYEYQSGKFGYDILSLAFGRGIFIFLSVSVLIAEVSLILGIRSIIFDWKSNSIFKRILSISVIPFSLLSFIGELQYVYTFLPGQLMLYIPFICNLILLLEDLLLIFIKNKAKS